MLIKGIEEDESIQEYPVIKDYKYLDILIDNKIKITKHIGNIDKKLNEYFSRNFILNKRYFSNKSIMLFLNIFINLDFYIVYQHLLIKRVGLIELIKKW